MLARQVADFRHCQVSYGSRDLPLSARTGFRALTSSANPRVFNARQRLRSRGPRLLMRMRQHV